MDWFEKIGQLIDFSEFSENKKKKEEIRKKIEISYENLSDFIKYKNLELQKAIEETERKISEELAKAEVIAKQFRNQFEKEYILELKEKIMETKILLEQIDEAVLRIKRLENRWKTVALILMALTFLNIGFVGGVLISKFLLSEKTTNTVNKKINKASEAYIKIPLKKDYSSTTQ